MKSLASALIILFTLSVAAQAAGRRPIAGVRTASPVLASADGIALVCNARLSEN